MVTARDLGPESHDSSFRGPLTMVSKEKFSKFPCFLKDEIQSPLCTCESIPVSFEENVIKCSTA
jgi:hypothetical protein